MLLPIRSSSTRDTTSPVDPQEAIALLLRELTMFHQVLQQYGVDPALVAQAFRQVILYLDFVLRSFILTLSLSGVLLHLCVCIEQPAVAEGDVSLVQRYPDPL